MGDNRYPEDRSYRAWHQQQMQNPHYAREFEAQRPEFDAIIKLIELRRERGMSQKQLAEKAGTTQPSVARLESRKKTRNLNLLERMADALGHKVTVGVELRKADSRTLPGAMSFISEESPRYSFVDALKVVPKKAAAKKAAGNKSAPRKRAMNTTKAAPKKAVAKKAASKKATPTRKATSAASKRSTGQRR